MRVRAAVIAILALPATLSAQDAGYGSSAWALRMSAVLSGASYESAPDGYKIYSSVALEAGVARRLSEVVSIELSARTESREVNGPPIGGVPQPLGSLELLPLSVIARWHPLGRSGRVVQPVVGVGVNLTHVWEKSGAIDSSEVTPTWSPVLHGSTDIRLSERAVLKLDAKWQLLKIDIEDFASSVPRVSIDPLSLGLGVEVGL
jgi:outer membrane protein W